MRQNKTAGTIIHRHSKVSVQNSQAGHHDESRHSFKVVYIHQLGHNASLLERMSQSGCRHTCAGTCRHVSTPGNIPTCADMCRHMPTCDIIFGPCDTNDLDLICMLTYVSTCGHADMCWYVLICADMCRHVLMCADMCRYVPTCNITLGTSDTNHLDLITMLARVSTCGHADMCWHVPTYTDTWHHFRPLWYQWLGSYLHADICQHMWTCWHVLICTDMCPYVPTCVDMCQHVTLASLSAPLIPTFWTLSAHWQVSAHVDMPACADMCRHVLICADMSWYVPTCANM